MCVNVYLTFFLCVSPPNFYAAPYEPYYKIYDIKIYYCNRRRFDALFLAKLILHCVSTIHNDGNSHDYDHRDDDDFFFFFVAIDLNSNISFCCPNQQQ